MAQRRSKSDWAPMRQPPGDPDAVDPSPLPERSRRFRDDDMTTHPRHAAALALHRFGFGPVAGSIAAIAGDPREALLADLERPGAGRVAAANLPNSGQAARAFFEFRAERQAKEKLAQRAKKETEAKGIVVGAADDSAMKSNGDASAAKAESAQNRQNQQPPPLPVQLVQNE